MPLVKVNDIQIMYEAFGDGETVIWLQSPWGGRNPGAYYVAGRLSEKYRVIIWDCPNTGQSGKVFTDAPSEWHLCCTYLKGLCDALNESSVHLAGCSGGGELALLFAFLYPNLVKSVTMYRPTDTTSSAEKEIVHARYFTFTEIAEKGTMEDIIQYSSEPPPSRWSGCSRWIYEMATDSQMKAHLLSFSPQNFMAILKKWGDWMGKKEFYKANIDDDKLRKMNLPVLIAPSADPFHPEKLAIDLSMLLSNSKYIPSPFYRTENEMYGAPGEEHGFGGLPDFLPHLEIFLAGI